MSNEQSIVIVGASLAGAKAAQALRENGFTGSLTLIGDEPDRPYERPPLSKDYLQGSTEREKIFVHPEGWYAEHDVDLRLGARVTAIDRDAHTVTLAGGDQLHWDKLLLTTGSTPRTLPTPGIDEERVFYLRRVADSDRLKAMIGSSKRIIVVGAGWIGLEVTAAARIAGVEVTVLEMLDLPLLRVLGPEVAQVFADLHDEHNVDLRFGVKITGIIAGVDSPVTVTLEDGRTVDGDAIVLGVGIAPNVELAEQAGLATKNGITVDEHLATSDPDIFAAGDVANAFNPALGKSIRVEHWYNAVHQPEVVAKSMLGIEATYDQIPYFYTDQYDLGMEYVGYAEPGESDQVVFRGDKTKREFVVFWLKDRRVLAGMNVNIWDVNDQIKDLVASGKQVDIARLSDPSIPLDAVLSGPDASSEVAGKDK
ncbi:NAD(P)/FAD-dependent oxidoreductase [Homoserinimonas sp. OAct 916]|uniref:NAD(P)/FAD-dependent oxidoreductase n=1 Tax=Homoserinimonas sp. OAct 916 TaxID=2211450 RepID=UPI000DBE96A4|nr:FAD-dependent oxidoreductase [Homoserinimonas sp. OAct 916]